MYKSKKPTASWVERICLECAQSFSCPRYEVERGGGKYCNLSCSTKARSKDHYGSNNPNYKGEKALSKIEYKKRFRQRYPEKAKAHDAVHKALKSRKISKQACEVCGITNNIHAHHDDYNKPLEIRWLCDKHHRIEHGASC